MTQSLGDYIPVKEAWPEFDLNMTVVMDPSICDSGTPNDIADVLLRVVRLAGFSVKTCKTTPDWYPDGVVEHVEED